MLRFETQHGSRLPCPYLPETYHRRVLGKNSSADEYAFGMFPLICCIYRLCFISVDALVLQTASSNTMMLCSNAIGQCVVRTSFEPVIFFDAFGHDLFWVMPQLCRNHLDFSIWDLRLTAIDSRMDHGPLQGLPPNVLGLTVSRSWARWAESKLAIDYCLPGATCSWRLGNSFHESCTSRPRPSST